MPEIEEVESGFVKGTLQTVRQVLSDTGVTDALVTAKSWGLWATKYGGKALWVVGSTIAVVGVPYAFGSQMEAMLVQQENAVIQQLRSEGYSMQYIQRAQEAGKIYEWAATGMIPRDHQLPPAQA